jgi:hypothetical protein
MLLKKRFVYVCKRRAESESRASDQGQSAKLLIHKNGSGAATRNSSETSIKHKMLRIEPRLAFINVVLLANRVLIFRFQLLAVYVLLEVDTAASILHGVKIVQIHNITKKPTNIYVLSLYNFDAM